MFGSFDLFYFLSLILTLVISIGIHEGFHALTAYYLGDPTPKIDGRLTFNPIAHLDPIGCLVFLVTQSFGWGKPVIINPNNFKNPVRDSAITALAGPIGNILLAIIAAPFYKLVYFQNRNSIAMNLSDLGLMGNLEVFLGIFVSINIILALFNLLPFPPLDGSKILMLIIPKRFRGQYLEFLEKGLFYFIAFILIDGLIIAPIFDWSVLGYTIGNVAAWLQGLILFGT